MCIRYYNIGVCPYCPNTRAFLAPGKLYNDERMVRKKREECKNRQDNKSCHDDPALRDISIICLCRKDAYGRDKRAVDACKLHKAQFKQAELRDPEKHRKDMAAFEKANLRMNKHPLVICRLWNAGWEVLPRRVERRLDYAVLKMLGYVRKADLEYDDPRDLKIAMEEDRRHEERWKVKERQQTVDAGSPGDPPPLYSEVADSKV